MPEAGGVRASTLTTGRLEVDLFNVNIDLPNFHPHHLFDGSGDRLLHLAADLSSIDPVIQGEVKLGRYPTVFNLDLHPLAGTASE